jgi:thiol-disulfide isomerase/thioredoxin
MIDRRDVCIGAVAALLAGEARAAADSRLFTSGPLSRNSLARRFGAPPGPMTLPDLPVVGSRGADRLSSLKGRTRLVSLWSEWCAPCLMEAGDLAELGQAFNGPSFEVVFVLTGSGKKLDFDGAHAVLAKYRAGAATSLIEPDGHMAVMNALAMQDLPPALQAANKVARAPSLPCNLLVDREGRVRGRSFGVVTPTEMAVSTGHPLTDADKAKLLTLRSPWAGPAGREFVAALAAGALDKA